MGMQLRTVSDLHRCINTNLWRVPPDTGLLVGTSQGGMLAASIIGNHLGIPVTALDAPSRHPPPVDARPRRDDASGGKPHVLLVDDVFANPAPTDDRLAESALTRLEGWTGAPPARLTVFSEGSEALVGTTERIVLEVVSPPAVYEWSLFRSPLLARICLDIDGVLCVDPTSEENDDGERYREFLQYGSPLFLPSEPVMALVTNRLEKYRTPTQDWLARNGVRYDALIMMDEPDARARTRADKQASHKAQAYLRTGAELFVESDPRLAWEIAQLARRRVLAFPDSLVIDPTRPGKAAVRLERTRRRARRMKRVARSAARVAYGRLQRTS